MQNLGFEPSYMPLPHENMPPFLLFSWYRAFLPDLKERILADTGGKPGNALIIVPNQRPWRYMIDLFAADGKAVMLPQMLPVANMAGIWAGHIGKIPSIIANLLDQVDLLKKTVDELAESDTRLAAKFAKMDMAGFLPWGIKLSRLLDDIFGQGISPRDITVEPYEAGEYESTLLNALGRIGSRWHERLLELRYTTPGIDNYVAATNAGDIPPNLLPGPERPVYIAGFSTLTGSQERLFHALWEQGARICLHTDPLLADGECDPACDDQKKWLEKWHAKTICITPPEKREPTHSFFAGYDGHSQIVRMVDDLAEVKKGSCAIILPDPELLMPVLHHLPDRQINISMGYPLSRTRLYGLLHELFAMHTRRRPAGKYYWKDIARLIHHPILKMLKSRDGCELRPALEKMDGQLRAGSPWQTSADLLDETCRKLPPREATFLQSAFAALVAPLEHIRSPQELSEFLANFCDFFLQNANPTLKSFPIDEEALARLRDNVLPMLANNEMAAEEFDLPGLETLLFMLLDQERIPFEADPLTGTQILGLLETRLLHFDNVFILDASDNLLPGNPGPDPLLPDTLRGAAGLPHGRSRQAIVANNLFRLCNNADHVYWYWAEGVTPSSLDSAKKYRSRFLERLIWKIEQEKGELLETGGEIIGAAVSRAHVNHGVPRPMARTASHRRAMDKILSGKLSATRCNEYLSCPLKFAYHHVLKLNSPAEVTEGDDPLAIGTCVHDILKDLFSPHEGKQILNRDLLLANLETCITRRAAELEKKLPPDAFIFFVESTRKRLHVYLERMELPEVRATEKEYDVALTLGDRDYNFQGKVDRLDQVDGRAVIIDYKTGYPNEAKSNIWNEWEFLDSLDAWTNGFSSSLAEGDELLSQLREKLPSVQLLVYALMVAESEDVDNAAFVWLRKGDKKDAHEEWLWEDGIDRTVALRGARIILGFLLKHMRVSEEFAPVATNCEHCDYADLCASRIAKETDNGAGE